MRLLVIGAGNMGLTYAKGIDKANLLDDAIMILEKTAEGKEKLQKDCPNFDVYSNPNDCVQKADVIMLAIKPFHAQGVFDSIKSLVKPHQIVVSVMAGVQTKTIQEGLGLTKVVRSMPNLPAMIGMGMTGFNCSSEVSSKESKSVQQLLESTGKAIELKSEDDIDKITGLSGSGSAYIFYFMDAMNEAAKEMGFSDADAKAITCQTFAGAVDLYHQNTLTPSEWIDKVCSKGGTTIAAINNFKSNNIKDNIKEGIFAAYNRAVELGNS